MEDSIVLDFNTESYRVCYQGNVREGPFGIISRLFSYLYVDMDQFIIADGNFISRYDDTAVTNNISKSMISCYHDAVSKENVKVFRTIIICGLIWILSMAIILMSLGSIYF